MDVFFSPIPLCFGYEPSSYTQNIDLASLDRSEEADKWLFDAGWKKTKYF
jgi:pyrimidine-specific ribonucleoside hydrolase